MVSHHKLPKQAITCKLAGIEADMWTANARLSFSEVASKKKKKQEEEVCLAIPLWSKIQAPWMGSQTPQHWFNPPCCDAPLTNMGLILLKNQDCWKAEKRCHKLQVTNHILALSMHNTVLHSNRRRFTYEG